MAKVIWEQVDELPCLTKIPADVIYLKFEFTYNLSIPNDPNFKRIFIYEMKRESVACLPAAMLWDMIVKVTCWDYLMPKSAEAMAKVFSIMATSELKKQDRAFGVYMVLHDDVQKFEEIKVHFVTWSATGTMMRCEETYALCNTSRFCRETGIVPGSEKHHCSICTSAHTALLSSLPCKHIFHYLCIREWARGTSSTGCPTCKSLLPSWARRSKAGINSASASSSVCISFLVFFFLMSLSLLVGQRIHISI